MTTASLPVKVIAAAAAMLLLAGICADAQSVRVTGVTSLQGVDLRPLVDDSVPIGLATGTGPYRVLSDGRLVRCTTGEAVCRFRSSGTRAMAAPVVQDLRAAAWGLGEGISVHAHVRLRETLGADPVAWPRSGDAFDALEAYAQLERGSMRARLGRQWSMGGLGLFNYDGASLQVRRGGARMDLVAGRSLIAGLNDPIGDGALASIDDLPPDEPGWLVGATGGWSRPGLGAVAATWQRVIRADRAALYSDRAALDASSRVASVSLDGSLVLDLSANEVNEASLRATRALPGRLLLSADLRRHRPFFEAWTIWGAFAPVAWDEARVSLGWRRADGRLSLDARGARRNYDETGEGFAATPLRGDGWRAGAGAEWTPGPAWSWYAEYDIDIGFGASRSDGVAGARWMPDENRSLGVAVSGTQNIHEFRVGTGRVLGLRLEGATRLGRDARVVGDAAIYSHRLTNGAAGPDWSQRRFSLRLEWTVGGDPGMAGARP